MIDRFIELFINKINEHYTCYYEEAPNNTSMPYLIVPTINTTPLDKGYLSLLDIEIYNNEYSNISVEQISDVLRDNLDGYNYYEKGLGYHLKFESQLLVKSIDQELTVRKVTVSARIFR